MDRGKNVVAVSSGNLREFTKWTTNVDLALLSAVVEEAQRGSRVDGSWTTQGYNNIVMTLNEVGMHII